MKCQYRVRWFSSKGASLVLLWTLLSNVACISLFQIVISIVQPLARQDLLPVSMYAIPLLLSFLSAPLSGWLADAKFGNYKVFRASALLLFISTVINCLMLILEALVSEYNNELKWIHMFLGSTLFVISGCTCFVTALPLGLDQMPDASSSSITSYIAWFVCCIFCGGFLYAIVEYFQNSCLNNENLFLVWSFILTLCMAFVFLSSAFFRPKWLIIEPKSPQSLKTIYRVLEFAAKHKSPVNRSALTYWENSIPSRINLGKSKYGGPFTTEQVEDVKTILSLFALALPFLFLSFSLTLDIDTPDDQLPVFNSSLCSTRAFLNLLAFNSPLYGILGMLAYEFLVYPIAKNRLSFSILKRIFVVPLVMTLVSSACLAVRLPLFILDPTIVRKEWITHSIHHLTNGLLSYLLLTAELEFVCAQSPYNMRGLLVSLVVPPMFLFVGIVGWSAGYEFFDICTQWWCSIIPLSAKFGLGLAGFLLFCVVACWYKRRVRDEDYSPQRVVEEVYDRYLTAAVAHSRMFGGFY